MSHVLRLTLGLLLLFALAGCQGKSSTGTAGTSDANPRAGVTARILGQVGLRDKSDASGTQVYVPGTSLIALTDKNGSFALSGVGPGTYQIEARADGFQPALLGAVTVTASATAQDYTLPPVMLAPRASQATPSPTPGAFGSLSGLVRAPGADLTQCTIELEGTPYRTTANDDGSFLLWNLPPDQYHLVASLGDLPPVEQDVRVRPGADPTTVTLQFKSSATSATIGGGGGNRQIRGIVELHDPNGQLTNDFDRILVEVANHPELSTKLEPDGRFAMNNVAPAHYVLTAAGAGYQPSSPVDVDLTTMPSVRVQFTLQAAGPTTGTMATLRGAALKAAPEGVAVTALAAQGVPPGGASQSGITVALQGTSQVAVTDADGRYTLANIPPGTYTLIATAEGYEPAQLGPIELTAGETLDAEQLLLQPHLNYPLVLAVNPPTGTRDVTIRRQIPIMVRFNKKMDFDSVRQAIRIQPAVAFTVAAGRDQAGLQDPNVAQIILSGGVEEPIARFRTHYTMNIGTEARDVEGLNMQKAFQMTFNTGAPAIIGTDPANGQIKDELAPSSSVNVMFNVVMDHTTLNPDMVTIRPAPGQVPIMFASEDPQTGWSRLSIQTTWQPGTVYRVTIGRRGRTAGNEALANTPYTFTFQTARLVPFVPPEPPGPTGFNMGTGNRRALRQQ